MYPEYHHFSPPPLSSPCPSHLHHCKHFLNDVPASSMSPSVSSPLTSQSDPVKNQDGSRASSAQPPSPPWLPSYSESTSQKRHCLQGPSLHFSDVASSELFLTHCAPSILAFLLFLQHVPCSWSLHSMFSLPRMLFPIDIHVSLPHPF